ncbi:helix-hairpin-helix domain-containing protein [Cupriavidus sp. AU9028]|uniref:ComEA family DNA-binding protein n=1 Tax=Cupriavidus sp. AU9028 TaxID=2871157 RepID=UPI001C94174B|nr:helix-hairpin-helix domain-containing protein [Cupriavidus sp. AU9028]MBY4895605.1 helix-hairpin-helix domain-containing protein [Cupriavidus sp. AU9028]
MFKKTLLALCCGMALWTLPGGDALAAVDINRADEAALTGLKGIGPALAHRIVQARDKDGPFRDGGDLSGRVKGIGSRLLARLQQEGLVFGSAAVRSGNSTRPAKPGPGSPVIRLQATPGSVVGPKGEVKAAPR